MLKCIILVALNYLQKTERLVDKVCNNKYFILFWTYMHICLFNRYTTEPASGQRQHRLIQIESIVFINWGSKMSTYNDSANIHMVFFSDIMITMSYISILFLFEVSLYAQSTSFLCEQMGMCSIFINETEFSCGEQYKNITMFDFPKEYRKFWWVILTVL